MLTCGPKIQLAENLSTGSKTANHRSHLAGSSLELDAEEDMSTCVDDNGWIQRETGTISPAASNISIYMREFCRKTSKI